MTYETNIVALAENDFLDNTRKLMGKRDTAFSLYQWVIDSLREGKHLDEIGMLVGDLINENFALEVQLKGRAESRQ
ncbi:TPA: hypothetical protein ACTYZB_004835 [Klebsiella variicola]